MRSGGLGDTILFSHVLGLYTRYAEPGEPVAVLTPAASVKTTFLFPSDIEIIGVDYRRFLRNPVYRARIGRALYRRHFRAVISTDHLRHPLVDEAMMAACRAPECIAMAARRWPKHDRLLARNRRLFTRLQEDVPARAPMYLRWVAFANWLNGRSDPAPLPRMAEERLPAPTVAARPYVVMQPFSAARRKQPPVDLFLDVVRRLGPGHDVVVTGGPEDLGRNPGYARLTDAPRARYEDAPFEALVPLLRGARLVVSVDTALMHLAVAVGAPTLCLASAAFVGELVPYPAALTPANVRFVYHQIPCEGCLADCPYPAEDGMYPCVARLEPGRVLAAVDDMLGDEPGDPVSSAASGAR